MTDVRDRQQLLTLHKKAKKVGFDLNQYNMLKEQINKVEYDLRKLRNPRRLLLPPTIVGKQTTTNATTATETDASTKKTTDEQAKNDTTKEKDSALKKEG